ncbi:MAG: hypothetical protein AAFQ82_16400 [Myxococcota bacterium]
MIEAALTLIAFAAVGALIWTGIIGVRIFSGWGELVERFAYTGKIPRLTLSSVRVGALVRGALVAVRSRDLTVYMLPPWSLVLKPFAVSYAEIEAAVVSSSIGFREYYLLQLRGCSAEIRVSKRLLEKIRHNTDIRVVDSSS